MSSKPLDGAAENAEIARIVEERGGEAVSIQDWYGKAHCRIVKFTLAGREECWIKVWRVQSPERVYGAEFRHSHELIYDPDELNVIARAMSHTAKKLDMYDQVHRDSEAIRDAMYGPHTR